MFGRPGRFHIYRSMGIHILTNIVCEPEGHGSAVLLRALEPLEGIETMIEARGGRDRKELTNGPGKLSQAFGITLQHYGRSALRGALRLLPPRNESRGAQKILYGPRIGISQGSELPYRFFLADSPWVTRSPLNRQAQS